MNLGITPMAMNAREPQRVLKGGESSDYISHLTTKALLALVGIFMFSLWRIFTYGAIGDYLLLSSGALLSGLVLFAYSSLVFSDKDQKSWRLASIALSGFIPYLFGAYLVFYRGLWSLHPLLSTFSLAMLLKGILFILMGGAIVVGIYNMTELNRAIKEGEIVIE